MSRPTVFTDEFLLWSIGEAWEAANGKRPDLRPEDSLWPLIEEGDDYGLFFFQMELQRLLGVDVHIVDLYPPPTAISFEEWREQTAPKVTVGDLMAYLRKRVPDLSFAPLLLPGAPGCDAAGWFLGIRDMLALAHPNIGEVAPSQPIRGVLRGTRLLQVWHRLHDYTRGKLPIPGSRVMTVGNWCLSSVLIFGYCAIALEILQPGVGWFLFGLIWGFKFLGMGHWLREQAMPLPPGVETFGDMARYAARLAPRN